MENTEIQLPNELEESVERCRGTIASLIDLTDILSGNLDWIIEQIEAINQMGFRLK